MNKKEFFVKVVLENSKAGFVRGQQMFAEGLNEDLQKKEILESVGIDGVVDYLIQEYTQRNN